MTALRRHILRFARREDGFLAAEFIIMFPLLIWAFLAIYGFYDVMRVKVQNEKAAYSISDMLSRETQYITPTYISNTKKFYDYLLNGGNNSALRVSSVRYSDSDDQYKITWSQVRGGQSALTSSDIYDYHDHLPILASGDELILVETWNDYEFPVETGIDDFTMTTFVFTRPRFAAQLKFDPDG
ncbi:TadE/TadG family type IV pilus assembly protein [Pseudooceanicola aestuarii]|uniref:TadE/TadG family type IV pilus assembly protein n=1 Tax=Pseudooceanicola aestuarii TaxID=2697319 RepID=UPI0013D4C27B|nr:hypothetical protein [Pseudooceanicola aestuarii]